MNSYILVLKNSIYICLIAQCIENLRKINSSLTSKIASLRQCYFREYSIQSGKKISTYDYMHVQKTQITPSQIYLRYMMHVLCHWFMLPLSVP